MKLKNLIRIILLVAVLLLLTIVPVNAVVYNNGAFDSNYYVNSYEDLNNEATAYDHFMASGINEWRRPSPVFDAAVYLKNNPDVEAVLENSPKAAYNHFITFGMFEHRVGSNEFNVDIYLANYADVKAVYGNNMASVYNQYVYSGIAEGRVANKLVADAEVPGAEDHVHDWKLDRVVIGATCKTDGEGVYKCSCGEEETRVIPASSEYHSYTEQIVNGVKVKVCSICNDTQTVLPEGVSHVHKYKEISRVPATCQEEGLITKECQNADCDERYVYETIKKELHVSNTESGKGYVLSDATKCGTDGAELVYCTNMINGKLCGERFERAISAHNYDNGTVIAKATCTEKGTKKFTCKDCGATKYEDIDALGHNFGATEEEPVEIKAATCEDTGIAIKVCNRAGCGYKEETTLKALGHNLETNKATAEKVYVQNGKVVTTDKKAYDGTNAVSRPASETSNCKYDIAEIIVCGNGTTLCEEKDAKVLNIVKRATGHVAKAGTTAKTGIATIDMDTVIDPVTGIYDYSHYDYVRDDETEEIVFNTNAKVDCCHEMIKVIDCKYCGEAIVVVDGGARKAHSGVVKTIEATCEDGGYKQTSCTVCKETVLERTTAKATGHNYAYVAETCTTDAMLKCQNPKCTKTLTETDIQALTPESESGKNDQALITKVGQILTKAGITHSEDNRTWTLEDKANHSFKGNVVLDATDKTKGTIYCENKCCAKLNPITVKVTIAEKAETGTIAVLDNDGNETETYNVAVTYNSDSTIKSITLQDDNAEEPEEEEDSV